MDVRDFTSGTYKTQFQYKCFTPNPVNLEWRVSDAGLNTLLSHANIALGELNAFSQLVPDIDFFIQMHVAKEGTKSSRIEGTQTNIDEALQKAEYVLPEKKDDWQEVQKYIAAMNSAIAQLSTLPLSTRLLKETHRTLLQGVRGEHKNPGEFRTSQNWIGGSSLNDAAYIPPHYEDVPGLMGELEKFLHNDDVAVPDLIRIAIAHYQFETVHPFLDGNGRIGRLLITLYLVNKGLLVRPTLYLSDFFERNKSLYYDNLMRVRTHNDLTQWLRFFLEGVRQTADNSIETFRGIIALRRQCEEKILTLGKKAPLATSFLRYLYGHPITDSQCVAAVLDVNITTALRLIEDFERLAIVKETTGYKRNRIFSFDPYIKLFR
jgi:Fic family protein